MISVSVFIHGIGCPLRCCFGALGAEAHAALQTGEVLCHEPPEVTLELLSHKGVKHRANAAVGVGDVFADVQSVIQILRAGSLISAGSLYGLKEDDNVVGCPANEEGKNNDEDELDGTTLLPHAGGKDADGDGDVAVHQGEKWNQEEAKELLVITDQTPHFHGALTISGLFTHQPIGWTLPHVSENQLFHACADADTPDRHCCNDGIYPFPALSSCYGMNDCKVSVKCHEGEEKDGAVESNEVSTVDHLTQNIPKNPFRLVIDGQEGEAGGEQNIGEDQIQKEDVCHCVELLILVDDEEDKAVSKVTEDKVGVIEGRDDFCTKIVDGLLRT